MYMRAGGRVGRRSKGKVHIDPIYFARSSGELLLRNLHVHVLIEHSGYSLYLFVQALHYSDLSGFEASHIDYPLLLNVPLSNPCLPH